ncbi:MAG: thioredoxin domain-containing protein [Bdellovibrionota bacterium]|nr:MAG: thioredoxin domain-containing protein [Bdellovibrionota bacterium]
MTKVSNTVIEARSFLPLMLALAVLGALLSMILLVHHVELKVADELGIKRAPSACSINETFDCDVVARSPWSELFGLPLGAYGLAFFLSACVVLAQALRRGGVVGEELSGWLVMSCIASAASIGLLVVSKLSVGSFCLYCMGVYATCCLMLLVCWWYGRHASFFSRLATGIALLRQYPRRVLSADPDASSPRWISFCILLIVLCSFMMPSFVAARVGEKKAEAQFSRQEQEISTFLARWRATEAVAIDLDLAPGAMMDHGKGEPAGRVRIVEFLDLECPACRHFAEEMTAIMELYPKEVHVVLKNYPLDRSCNPAVLSDMHRNACFFAQAGRCAGEQGKYWEAVDFIFSSNDAEYDSAEEHRREVVRMVDTLNLDPEAFQECMQSPRHLEKIQDDIRQGNALQIEGTPTVFVDGKRLPTPSVRLLKAILHELVGRDPD